MKPDLLERISKNVILADGALGSYLYEQDVDLNSNLDSILMRNTSAKVACETMVTTGMALFAGEIHLEFGEKSNRGSL